MSNYISFLPAGIPLRGPIRFVLTKSSYQHLIDLTGDPLRALAALSASRTLMGFQDKDGGPLKICTPAGTFNCQKDKDGNGLTITAFRRTYLNEQNTAMKQGVCFRAERGILVHITLGPPYEQYCVLQNGSRYSTDQFAGVSGATAMQTMFAAVEQARAQSRQTVREEHQSEVEEEEEYTPDWQLEELLDTAEDYANLSAELELQKANDTGKVPYYSISGTHYDRLDRIAYTFGVRDLDETLFKENTQVEVEDREGNTHTAKVMELVKKTKDSPATAMVLLFTKQVSKDIFSSQGFFTLSYSSVNRDVQLAAIEKIRTGTARSAYMDAVLGRNEPAGFDRKDMTPVEQALAQREHPLNPAQLDAVQRGINARDILLVMGPPGTGKTTVIQEWVRYFVTQEHKRVLVSSQNHKAVDNVFTRLAEETDIEMIRIGAESNLQAEVVPYTFEKKIEALRQRIEDGTGEHLATIRELLRLWQDYANTLEQASVQEQEVRRLHEQFVQQVRTQLLPLYDRLQSQLAQHAGLQRRMEKLAATMHRLADKLRFHENATNVFVRFFTGLLYKFRRNRLRKLPGQLAQLRGEEQLLMQTYRRDYDTYLAQQTRLKNGPYLALAQMRDRLTATMQTLARKPHYDPSRDIWDLFTGSLQLPVADPTGIAALRDRLRADMTRARGLGKTLQDWQRDMADKQNYALGEIILESVSLVGATCIGVNSQRRFADLDFDVTIIDEAGQIQIHNALVPMSVSGKVIMLGDHKQIPPQQDPELEALCAIQSPPVDPALLRMSLFEWLYNNLPESNKRILDTQYRIPGQIADIISHWFYDSKYLTFQNKRGLNGVLPRISASPFVIIDTSGCDHRYETPQNKSYFNDLEATIAATLVQHIAQETDIDLAQVGVVSAQKPQTARIRQKTASFLPRDVVDGMVATLDSFQGQERDVIIFSFTRSSSKPAHSNRIGFLKELRRLNVAMTRAKKTLVLIGDMEFLSSCACQTDKFGNPIEDSEKRFSEFIQTMLTAVETGSGQRMTVREFLDKVKGGEA